MERFNDTASKRSKLAKGLLLISISIGILTGCQSYGLDGIRPDVNVSQNMVVFRDSLENIENLGVGVEAGSPTPTTPDEGSGSIIGDSSRFAALPYTAVAASSYSQYLNKEIYEPIANIIDGLGIDKASRIYFRVFHTGYDPISEGGTEISRGSTYDNKKLGSLTTIRGTALPILTYRWLNSHPENLNVVSTARSSWVKTLEQSGISPNSTWLNAAGQTSIDPNIVKMWGNQRINANTFQQYVNAVYSDVIGTVPNITFTIAVNANSKTSITINPTANIIGNRYYDHMQKTSVDRLFGYYNQYPLRQCSPISVSVADDYSVVFAYIDGYSKTIVALACDETTTLREVFGNKTDSIISLIQSTKDYTCWSEISKYIDNVVLLPAGVRGVD